MTSPVSVVHRTCAACGMELGQGEPCACDAPPYVVTVDRALVEAVRSTCGDTTEEKVALANAVLAQLGVE